MKKSYELISHTADIGIRVRGKDRKELFVNTARAMFKLMAGSFRPAALRKINLKAAGANSAELLVNWLNELLFISATRGLIFEKFKINKFREDALEACAWGAGSRNYLINTEIKAATYHGLKIERSGQAWKAEVIFDV